MPVYIYGQESEETGLYDSLGKESDLGNAEWLKSKFSKKKKKSVFKHADGLSIGKLCWCPLKFKELTLNE